MYNKMKQIIDNLIVAIRRSYLDLAILVTGVIAGLLLGLVTK